MWSISSLDACNLLNLKTAAEFSTSCRIRALSAAKLQNLIKTWYSVLKTTTNHNQSILDSWTYQSNWVSFFYLFFYESTEMMEFILSLYFFYITILFLVLQITQSAGGEHIQELLIFFFLLTILFLILQITQSAGGEHTQELLIFFLDVKNKIS